MNSCFRYIFKHSDHKSGCYVSEGVYLTDDAESRSVWSTPTN